MRSNRKITQNQEVSQLGRTLRLRRKSLKLTQKQLGEYAGCGWLFVHDVEKGKPTVRLDKLLELLNVLGFQITIEPGKQVLAVKGAAHAK